LTGSEGQWSDGEESYRLLARSDGFRVGLSQERGGERTVETTIEVLVRLFWTGKKLQPGDMERAAAVVRALLDRGYSVYFQEDGWIACERPAGDVNPAEETLSIQRLLESR